MTNLKALLKFTREQIKKGTIDIPVDDYAELEYICGKAEGEVERLEEGISEAAENHLCPPGYAGVKRCIDTTCDICWRTYVNGGE